ncbi:MAG: TolB family protein [Telluria sp.]
MALRIGPAALLVAISLSAAAQTHPVVTPWSPPGISSGQFESHPAFDPMTGDLYFVRSTPKFEGWRLKFSGCTRRGWSAPQAPGFAADALEADPWFADGGKTLYFISNRATDGIERKDLDIWKVARRPDGAWGTPERLPAPVNSSGQEWFPRIGPDGWLYFGSNRPGGHGKTDIWRAREDGGQWKLENLGATVNSDIDEYEALPAPDGKSLIVMTSDGLFISQREGAGWGKRSRLPAEINVNGSEVGALFSPSGRSLLFARDLKGKLSGEFVVWHIDGNEAWPPQCRARR